MNWLGMVVSYVVGSMTHRNKGIKESVFEVYDEIIIKSRRIVTLTIVGLGSVIFLCGGLFIALLGGTLQYDQTGSFSFSATMTGGLILIALSLLAFAVVFGQAWPREHNKSGPNKRRPSPQLKLKESERPARASLDQALSLLILDFIKEREIKREARYNEYIEGYSHRQESRSSQESETTRH